jgi:hypothetical protein
MVTLETIFKIVLYMIENSDIEPLRMKMPDGTIHIGFMGGVVFINAKVEHLKRKIVKVEYK